AVIETAASRPISDVDGVRGRRRRLLRPFFSTSSSSSVFGSVYTFFSGLVGVNSSTRERSVEEASVAELVLPLVTCQLCHCLPSFSLSLCNSLKPDLSMDSPVSSRPFMSRTPCFNLQRLSPDAFSLSRCLSSSIEFSIRSPFAVSRRQASHVRLGSSGSEPHPVGDLFRSSSDPYTSALPQPLTPHLLVVAVVEVMKLTIIWRRRSHSGFNTTVLTLPLRLPPLPRLSPSASPPFPLVLVTTRRVSVRKPDISLDLNFHCAVMDLRFSSGLNESFLFRYGNIGVLLLSWISVCVPLWIMVKSIISSRHRLYYTPNIKAAPSHQGFYGAKLLRLNLCLLVTAGSIVQECCFARFVYVFLTVASLSHYTVSSIDGSSQSRICGLPDLLVAGTIIGLQTFNGSYGSRASHLKFLPINIPTSSYRCINVVFDYQLFFRTIAMRSKVKLPFGFLHFAEHDSPFDGSIFSCFVLFSSFFLPSSMFPGSFDSVVNSHAL
ncbi:unnamed protein product, partial [Brassica napus]